MAKKRMFSKKIIHTDAFLDMPKTAQLLYFHLCMGADDEGFVGSPKQIIRAGGFNDDDLKVLVSKRFVLTFETGILVIKHWLIHNTIRKDRVIESTYKKEKETLRLNEFEAYTEKRQPNGNQVATKCPHSIDKIRLDKTRLDKKQSNDCDINPLMDIFKKINPTINFGNKTQRNCLQDLIDQFGYEKTSKTIEYAVSIQGQKFAPTITTPYQLKNKLGDLMVFYKKETNSPGIVKI